MTAQVKINSLDHDMAEQKLVIILSYDLGHLMHFLSNKHETDSVM